jgi:hypothetical protein
MRVDVQGNVDLGLPQSLLTNLGMDPLLEHTTCGIGPPVVEPDVALPGLGKNPLGCRLPVQRSRRNAVRRSLVEGRMIVCCPAPEDGLGPPGTTEIADPYTESGKRRARVRIAGVGPCKSRIVGSLASRRTSGRCAPWAGKSRRLLNRALRWRTCWDLQREREPSHTRLDSQGWEGTVTFIGPCRSTTLNAAGQPVRCVQEVWAGVP